MEIILTEQFQQAYKSLALGEKRAVQKALAMLREDSRYPGLRVKKMHGPQDIWEARASKRVRMTFEMSGETLVMRNVGEHGKVLKRP